MPWKAEDGLRRGTDVRASIRAGKANKRLRLLQPADRIGEGLRRTRTIELIQMITMTEIKKALVIQNSILKKENEILKNQEEEIDVLINRKKK